jgi:hypothetical protein
MSSDWNACLPTETEPTASVCDGQYQSCVLDLGDALWWSYSYPLCVHLNTGGGRAVVMQNRESLLEG